jgi:nucleotide-binding universal stress UspA family protein
MRHILFPTDFSENAENAIYYGLSMYSDEPCKFTIFNTYPIPYANPDVPIPINDIASEGADKYFKLLIKNINKEFPNNTFKIQTEFNIGELVPTIRSLIKRKKINQIIMGTQGATGLTEALIGSSTASVIKHVKFPVIAIPEKSNFQVPKKIVLAVDGETKLTKRVLNPLLEIVKKYNSEVLILHVVKDNENEIFLNKKKLNQLLKDIEHSYHFIYDKNIPQGIEDFIEEQNASMIAMVTHKINFFERIFHRSITKKVTFHTEIPLLAMHDKK